MAKLVNPEQRCEACGLAVPVGTMRCPRCNHLLLSQLGCQGNCRACAAKCPSQPDQNNRHSEQ